MVWWWRGAAIATILLVLAVLATGWGTIVAGHPAYLVTLVGLVITAVAILVVSTARHGVRPQPPKDQAPDDDASDDSTVRHVGRWTVRAVTSVAIVAVWVAVWWLRPIGATQHAIEAMRDGAGVTVVESATRIELRPDGAIDPTGVVFYPGARVDARAYAPTLRPLAEAGHLVVLVKLPYWIAFADLDAASSVIGAEEDPTQWVVAGHSLGGVAAARYAANHVDDGVVGLLLWASFPASDMSDVDGLAVRSVSASNDMLTTPADVEASRDDLPPDSTFAVIDGANHAQFGDYGAQSGDGTATIGTQEAQAAIGATSLEFLGLLEPSGPAPD